MWGYFTIPETSDIILSRPEPDSYFSLVAPVLKSADIVGGQGEIPFTDKPIFTSAWSAIAAPTINYEVCPSKNVKALTNASADHFLAEHAHVLKGVEQYKGKTISYGLSDFIWNRSPREITSPQETEFRQIKLRECFQYTPTPDE